MSRHSEMRQSYRTLKIKQRRTKKEPLREFENPWKKDSKFEMLGRVSIKRDVRDVKELRTVLKKILVAEKGS